MKAVMVEIEPIRVEIDREDDGRILASVPDLPGVMAYGSTEDEAVRKVKSITLQVLADMIESGEDINSRRDTLAGSVIVRHGDYTLMWISSVLPTIRSGSA